MAKTCNLNIRMDTETKEAAERLFSDLGLTLTDAINIFLHQSLLYNGFPFPIRLPEPNATTSAAIREIENFINRKTSVSSQSVGDFFEEVGLDKDR